MQYCSLPSEHPLIYLSPLIYPPPPSPPFIHISVVNAPPPPPQFLNYSNGRAAIHVSDQLPLLSLYHAGIPVHSASVPTLLLIKVTGYRSGCGYLSLCNGELWQHTDRQRYQTYIIRQRSTYLMHTARTESLPRASRATDAVEIREFL